MKLLLFVMSFVSGTAFAMDSHFEMPRFPGISVRPQSLAVELTKLDLKGNTSLHRAMKPDQTIEQAEQCIAAGVDANSLNKNRQLPLHVLARNCSSYSRNDIRRKAELLLGEESVSEYLDNSGQTPSSIASQQFEQAPQDRQEACLVLMELLEQEAIRTRRQNQRYMSSETRYLARR